MQEDVVIFGAAGIVLGEPAEMLHKLKSVIKPGGYILIDEGYLPENVTQSDVKCNSYELLTGEQWAALFNEAGLELIETVSDDNNDTPASGDSDTGMAFIIARANELTQKHPIEKPFLRDMCAVSGMSMTISRIRLYVLLGCSERIGFNAV